MSRIGKKPVALPANVKVDYKNRLLKIEGPKGKTELQVSPLVELEITKENISVKADFLNDRHAKAVMGTTQALVNNMVQGVTQGYSRKLILSGVGYRATVSGSTLEMTLGYSKPVVFKLPAGVTAAVENQNQLTLNSHDKVLLGQTAAKIRTFRLPEPYQGKGVAYADEKIRRKAGKTGKK